MSEITLILGGARSGKSSYAERIARESQKQVLYVATATAGDQEMIERIAAHQAARPAHWHTLEAPRRIGQAIQGAYQQEGIILIDCLTLLTTNLLLELPEPIEMAAYQQSLDQEFAELDVCLTNLPVEKVLIVSNEVGLGLVPEYQLGRFYRDGLGRFNQRMAQRATEVLFMVAGLPMKVK